MISEKLSKYIYETNYEHLPQSIIKLGKMCFLDWLGCTIAASNSVTAHIFLDLIRELGGNKDATIIPYGDKTSVLNAALVNGVLSHFLELDDIHKKAMYHPGVPVIPAALAISEREKLSGKELITAIIMGYETGIRIGIAINPSHFWYWHTTGTVGTFAAAAASGKALRLTKEQLVYALGNAGTQASGLWEFIEDGAMTKPLHPGKAAQNGLLASLLAEKGFTGPSRIIEGVRGFGLATSKESNFESIVSNLGSIYHMNTMGFKIHVGCRHTNSPVDGTLELVNKYNLTPKDISKVTVRTYKLAKDLVGKTNPKNITEAKFSIIYCVAAAIKFRQCGIAEFTQQNLNDLEVKSLLNRINLVVDDSLQKEFPQGYASIVEIETTEKKKYIKETDYAKGDPENPVDWNEIENKFKKLAGTVLEQNKTEEIISKVRSIENISDITQVTLLTRKK